MLAASTLALLGCSSDHTDDTPVSPSHVVTVHATSESSATRATYNEQGSGANLFFAFNWDQTDCITLFADAANMARMTCETVNSPNDATFIGSFSTPVSQSTAVAGTVDMPYIETNGTTVTADLRSQLGTLTDATAHSIIYGTGTYNPSATTPLGVKFSQKMAFMKYVLTFPDVTSGTANVSIKADGLYNKVVLKTANGGVSSLVAGEINIANAAITDGVATFYVAVYPSAMSDISVTATVGGQYYTYLQKANGTIEPNKVYSIVREMVKLEDTGSAAGAYSGGSGTTADPYLIADAAQLRKMAADVNSGTAAKAYKLTQDIALSGTWTPIGTNANQMKGVTFDGDNHTIHGMINVSKVASAADGVGVFGVMSSSSTVRNLIVDADIINTSANQTTGGIVGKIQFNASLVHCQYQGQITSSSQFIGGIAGEAYATGSNNQQCLIEACTNTGSIISNYSSDAYAGIGGIIGRASIGSGAVAQVVVKGCRSAATQIKYANTSSKYFAGGLCGTINNPVANANVRFEACWCATDELGTTARALSICSGSGALFTAHAVFAKGISGVNLFRYSSMPTIDQGSAGTETECKTFSNATPWTANISNMNAVWASSAYRFNNNGDIVAKAGS